MSLEDIKELDDFYEFKQHIKTFILQNESLFRLIFFCYKNPFDETNCEFPENPYQIFSTEANNSNNPHGVILFKQKNDQILNYETPVILVKFTSETSKDSDSINYTKIEFSIICKGTGIQELENGKLRSYAIAELIDKSLNHIKFENSGEIKRLSFDDNSLNEENSGYKMLFQVVSTSYNDEIEIYNYISTEDEYGITRESHTLLSTTEPIFADIQFMTEDKNTKSFGYDITTSRRMICDIMPEITEDAIIKYDSQYYRIEKIVENDDYLDCTLVVTHKAVII